MLYIFAGKKRQTSLRACLERFVSEEFNIKVIEIDIIHGEDHDLSRQEVREAWLARIRDGEFTAILCTPPCSTWTRVRMANMRGPPPLRSRQYPKGYPWLKNHLRSQVELGTILVSFMVEVYIAANEAITLRRVSFVWLFSEHPEDLGRVIREEDQAILDPAAIWQLDEVRVLLKLGQLHLFTVSFNQCCFGAGYKKPTRILTNLEPLKKWGPGGWPVFDEQFNYMGPLLPCSCNTSWTLARRTNQEAFRTTHTSAYPPAMDAALAQAFFYVFQSSPQLLTPPEGITDSKSGERPKGDENKCKTDQQKREAGQDSSLTDEVREEIQEPSSEEDGGWVEKTNLGDPGNGMKGPMTAYYKGKHRIIHDGGGLGSPGRWPVESRRQLSSKKGLSLASVIRREFLKWIVKAKGRAEEIFWELARGEAKGSPFQDSLGESREAVDKALEEMGGTPRRREGDRDTEINFRRLAAMAEATGDEDFQYLEEMASKGVSLGVDEVMPRTPKVFEEKTKWAREFVIEELRETWADNYESAEEGKVDIWRQVDEEVANGTILKFTEEEIKAEYGQRVAVAALGAVPKELGSEKVRLIHDGSYSVDVNRRIKVRDRMRFPLIDDATAVLVEAQEMAAAQKTERRSSLVYDIKRAHKLIPVRREDWALQAFRLPGERKGEGVFVHTRGTFGVASAAYYWQRVAATAIRLGHRVGGKDLGLLHLLFADDGWLVSVGDHFWRPMLLWLFILEIAEIPISWEKVHGGDVVQWIGYELDIRRFRRGVSAKKVVWVSGWIKRRLEDGGLVGRDLKSALGRLVFVAGALQHVRPFLGPVFGWSAVLKGGIFAKMPDAVALLLKFIEKQISGEPMAKAYRIREDPIDTFRVDAKAEGEEIVIGGWESYDGGKTKGARWFSIRLNRRNAAWAYLKGEPYRNIAALELTAVLVATMLFSGNGGSKGRRTSMRLTALTDNVANSYVLKKYLSCKFPLSIILLELSCQLKKAGMELDLHWIPRDQNVPADSLTNGRFEDFEEDKRINVEFEDLEFIILKDLIEMAGKLNEEIKMVKTSKEAKGSKPEGKRKRGETKWKDPW